MLLNPLIESQEPQGRWPQRRQDVPALLDVPSLQQIHMIVEEVGCLVVGWLFLW